MAELFLKLLDLSVAASWLILAVLLLRLLFRRAPRAIFCLLWALVGLRLLVPFTIRSSVSLVPAAVSQEAVTAWTDALLRERTPVGDAASESAAPSGGAGTPSGTQSVSAAASAAAGTGTGGVRSDDVYPAAPETAAAAQARPAPLALTLSWLWLDGMGIMLVYAGYSYFRLRIRTGPAVLIEEGVWICDAVRSPFILGVFHPRIYLPSTLDPICSAQVLAHERAHLARRDHWWKPLGFLFLAVFWYHPLVWLAYMLFCRDVEMACDERVVREMTGEGKRDYAEALLLCSMPKHMVAAYPLAFGESGLRARIRAVLHYRKPAFRFVVTAAAVCLVVAACFLTEPRAQAAAGEAAARPAGTASAVSDEADADRLAAENKRLFEVRLQSLADGYVRSKYANDRAALPHYLAESEVFGKLSADKDALVRTLRGGFTVGGAREAILVYYALAQGAVEDGEHYDYEDLNDAVRAFESEPLSEARTLSMLAAVAQKREEGLERLVGAENIPAFEDHDRILSADDPAVFLLASLYEGFPAETGVRVLPAHRADGKEIELRLETVVQEVEDSYTGDYTAVSFSLSGDGRAYRWSYYISKDDRAVLSFEGIGYDEALAAIYESGRAPVERDDAFFRTLAEQYAALPFDGRYIEYLAVSRPQVEKDAGMTEETWYILRDSAGYALPYPRRILPQMILGQPWELSFRFTQEAGMEPYLAAFRYERTVESADIEEKTAAVREVFDMLREALGEPELPYIKAQAVNTDLFYALENGFSTNSYTASWVLRDGIGCFEQGDVALLLVLTAQVTPGDAALQAEYRLRAPAYTELVRYPQELPVFVDRSSYLWEAGPEDSFTTSDDPAVLTALTRFFGMSMEDFRENYKNRLTGFWSDTASRDHIYRKARAAEVSGVAYDMAFGFDDRYFEEPLFLAEFSASDPGAVTAEDVRKVAATLTGIYGDPARAAQAAETAIDDWLETGRDGTYSSRWIVDESPDLSGYRTWGYAPVYRYAYDVTTAVLSVHAEGGVQSFTLTFRTGPAMVSGIELSVFEPR